ncbi:LPS export ABC transporter permease LptG [Novispirillum itersonii]|uniref:LPS export ABC transporter permease LptG n=1 Tax=Novispirillum itersonii TaxID=189 RepID=UPI0003821F03|nr:LPS export ABC transporter permease LptG [Novispirillum itersonii]
MPRLYITLSAYIARHFLLALLGTLLVITALIVLMDFIELLRRSAGKETVDSLFLLQLSLMKLPTLMQQVMPFAVLIGGMIAMWRLTRSHELVVIRAAGVSVWQFMAPALLLVAVLGVVNVTVVNPLAALLYKRYEQAEDGMTLARQGTFNLSESGLWLREPRADGGQTVVHAASVRQDGFDLYMRDMAFIYVDGRERFLKRINARLGRLVGSEFELTDAWVMEPGQAGVFHAALSLPTTLTLGRVQENFASPETLSFWQLPGFISFFESAGFSAQRHSLYFHSLIASPILLCAMVIVAAVFSVRPNQRSGGGFSRVLGAVGSGFLLYFFSKLSLALGQSSTVPVWLSAWTPTLVTLLLGMATLLHLEDG